MWIFNPIQNPDERCDEVVLCIPGLFSVTPTCAIRCSERRSEVSQVLKMFKIKGFPRVGPFPNAFPQWGSDPGCSGESRLPPSWGPWGRHKPWAWQTCPEPGYPRALVLLRYPEVGLVMVRLPIFFFFNLPIIFFRSPPEFCLEVLNPSRWKPDCRWESHSSRVLKHTVAEKIGMKIAWPMGQQNSLLPVCCHKNFCGHIKF